MAVSMGRTAADGGPSESQLRADHVKMGDVSCLRKVNRRTFA